MVFSEQDLAAIEIYLSLERLGKLNNRTKSTLNSVLLHQETLRLGARLMVIIATIEIFIRNSVCDNLREFFGTDDWLLRPPAPFGWKLPDKKKIDIAVSSARRAEYAKLSHQEKIGLDAVAFPNCRPQGILHSKVSKKRQECIEVSDGKIVAELTFYFWKRLYGPDYQHFLWKRTLKKVFPNKKIERSLISDNLEILYQTRNRLAHHEPVLHGRYDEALKAVKFIARNLGMTCPQEDAPLYKLIYDDLVLLESASGALHTKLASYE